MLVISSTSSFGVGSPLKHEETRSFRANLNLAGWRKLAGLPLRRVPRSLSQSRVHAQATRVVTDRLDAASLFFINEQIYLLKMKAQSKRFLNNRGKAYDVVVKRKEDIGFFDLVSSFYCFSKSFTRFVKVYIISLVTGSSRE